LETFVKLLALSAAALVLTATSGAAFASEELAKSKACLACHHATNKGVGPAYKDISAKYRSDKDAENKLVEKVRAGGVGVWGQVPMPPNPAVTEADARTLVKWILAAK
jgi:cytochrome c